MKVVINTKITKFFTGIPPYEMNIYISYLYNPLENMFINLMFQYSKNDTEISTDFNRLFDPILFKHKGIIQETIEEKRKHGIKSGVDLVKNSFDLLYTELNSISYIRGVITEEIMLKYGDDIPIGIEFIKRQQDKMNYVSLYLSTIPLFLFMVIIDYNQSRTPSLEELQSFRDVYISYIDKLERGVEFINPDNDTTLSYDDESSLNYLFIQLKEKRLYNSSSLL
jgi:hypothetical protein